MAVITISRQFGAEGKIIGRRIADTLGYYYADEDIIERAVVEIYAVAAYYAANIVASHVKVAHGQRAGTIAYCRPIEDRYSEKENIRWL